MPQIDESVHVVEHKPEWVAEFAVEQKRITQALAVAEADLEHIGSTAVTGLAAKPIVDLMLGAKDWPPSPELVEGICRLGYEPLGEAGVSGRLYFRLRSPIEANLHVVHKGGYHWVNNLALREYLQCNQAARERYAQAKVQAIASGATSLLAYSAAKAAAVAQLLKEAQAFQNAS